MEREGFSRAAAAGALAAAAVMIKAQAAIPMIAFAWAFWRRGPRAAGAAVLGAAAVTGALLLPVVVEGQGRAFLAAMESLTRHDMVSGNAANLWWLHTWVFRAWYALELGAWTAFTMPVRVLALSTVTDLGHASLKPIALGLTVAAGAWACWRVARTPSPEPRTPALAAALGAFLVHAYFTLSVQVHENHLFLAIPLALVAGLTLPAHRRVATVLGVQQALNLFLFYGVGERLGWLPPRGWTVIDATVWLATASIAIFLWHARVLARATQAWPASRDGRI
jgi:hypothetical protein